MTAVSAARSAQSRPCSASQGLGDALLRPEAPARRHARHFLSLAEEAEPNLHGSGSTTEWLDRLEREHGNIRAALDWFEASGDGERALRLAGANASLRAPAQSASHS